MKAIDRVLSRYGLNGAAAERISTGLINTTFLVTAPGGRFILQRVNPMFAPEINRDIDAVTRHVAGRGLETPRLVPASDGECFIREHEETWRLLSHIEGESRNALSRPAEAESAGALLGRFHAALLDFTDPLAHARPAVHDTRLHIDNLKETLARKRDHPRFADIEPLGRAILDAAAGLAPLPALPARVVHGDPKIDNVIFRSGTDAARCLVDLDCIARMALPLELGDALRSWCNPAGEDTRDTGFSADLFRAAITGYAGAAGQFVTEAEWRAIVPATCIIYMELAARFCADALNEDYFGWDPARFAGHSEHSEVRAAGQLHAACVMTGLQAELDASVADAFGAPA